MLHVDIAIPSRYAAVSALTPIAAPASVTTSITIAIHIAPVFLYIICAEAWQTRADLFHILETFILRNVQ